MTSKPFLIAGLSFFGNRVCNPGSGRISQDFLMDSSMIDGQTEAAMKRPSWTVLFVFAILVGPGCLAKANTLKEVNQLELNGQFKQAAALLHTSLES